MKCFIQNNFLNLQRNFKITKFGHKLNGINF
jgi:hypothetical protein